MLPFLNIFGKAVPLYGICMLVGFYLTIGILMIRVRKIGVRPETVLIVAALLFGGAITGGSLLYVFVTYPMSYIIECIKNFDFSFLMGGIVFYGGLIGGIIGAFIGAKIAKIKLYVLEDYIVPLIPLGHAIGRVGCVFAGCCHGMAYDGPLAVKSFLADPTGVQTFFPVQLVEAVLDLAIMAYLFYYVTKPHKKYDAVFRYLLLYGIMRLFTEMLRADDIRGKYFGISTSQWISLALILAFVIRQICYFVKNRKNKENETI